MIRIESPDLNRLALGAKEFPKPLRTAIRKELRGIAAEAAQASRSKIRAMPAKGERPYRGDGSALRQDIAQAIRVNAVITSRGGASVRIRIAETAALMANRRFRVAQLLDAGKPFRHPIFGEWVEGGSHDQQPYPYFRKTMEERAPQIRAAAETSLRTAILRSIPNLR